MCGSKTYRTAKLAATCSTYWNTSSHSRRCATPSRRASMHSRLLSNPRRRHCDNLTHTKKGTPPSMKQPPLLRRAQCLSVALLCSCAIAAAANADTVVVTADPMIDVLAGRVLDHPQITIVDGRIAAVAAAGTAGGAAVPAGARRVDLPGMTLLPGLIDMHTHITVDPRYGGYSGLEFTDNFWTVVGVANARKTLEAGFTTIRNVGSSNFDDVAIKQGIEQGMVPGPRIVPATYAIGATGGNCDSTEFPPPISVPGTTVQQHTED